MEENNVLDDWQEDVPPPPRAHFKRALRFFLYALGITLVLGGRILFVLRQQFGEGGVNFNLDHVNQLFLLGVAGTWLFSGLGLTALYRALRERQTDLAVAMLAVGHLTIFTLSCVYLIRSFRWLLAN